LIRRLITVVAAAITDAIITAAITAAVIAAAITATVDTAGRRRSIDPAAGWRRRRDIDLAAATCVVAAAPISVSGTIATGIVAICLGAGRNGGGSECENCRGYDGYPAEFQHHETSPVIFGGEPALKS
jgi:hypothetical protein